MVTLCDDEMTRLHAALALTPLPAANACFFLDVDGTLLDFAATPDGVHVDDELIELLAAAARSVQGALALVSGRSLESLDSVLAPLQLPAAGVHGFERRDARGIVHRQTLEENRLESARAVLEQFVARHPGLLLEDKRAALALHFRQVPNLEELVQVELARTLPGLRPDFELLEGEAVLEIKPAGLSKATAVEAFMREAPFAGRVPVFVGDDLTDSDGFSAARRHRGLAVAVGDRVWAEWRLPSPAAVRAWLTSFVQRHEVPA